MKFKCIGTQEIGQNDNGTVTMFNFQKVAELDKTKKPEEQPDTVPTEKLQIVSQNLKFKADAIYDISIAEIK